MSAQRTADIRDLDRRAVEASLRIVALVTPDQLHSPTPCTVWDVADLLAHMTVQHRGFAAAAGGSGPDLSLWQPARSEDPVGQYALAAQLVVDAFRDDSVLDRQFWLPELSETGSIPAGLAISFHFIDYVVHSWDLAVSIGTTPELDDDLLEAALSVAHGIPDGKERLAPGAFFGPSLPVPTGPLVLDQVLALLGRSPAWEHPESPRVTARR